MDYIVLDLEWNQSPNGKEDSARNLPFEIIEIGAVKLDGGMQRTGEFRRLIRPQVYTAMHFKISEVTHMDMEELCREGIPFPQAMEEFLEWCGGGEYRFCTWGSMDLTELQRNMAYHQMENPFPRPFLYYDVQKLYCLQYGDGKLRSSLDQAVSEQEIPQERPFHRAADDAFYTAQIMARLDMERVGGYVSVDYYLLPRTAGEEYTLKLPGYTKYVSREFDSREEMMKDKRLTDVVCGSCNRMLRKKLRWFPWGQRFYFCGAVCPEHGFVRGKIRVKKSEQDRYYGVKTMRPAQEEEMALLAEKKEEVRRKRSGKGKN
ncbi:MAG: exonuclease domain-containing protein [Clostridiales bacterium]|nr:exonuclease domain-containing protein [Clostridiales bacterium]